eukprot:368857-Pelagomonas_calceolata.AAC.7
MLLAVQSVRDQVYAELQDRMHALTKERDASKDAATAADTEVRRTWWCQLQTCRATAYSGGACIPTGRACLTCSPARVHAHCSELATLELCMVQPELSTREH